MVCKHEIVTIGRSQAARRQGLYGRSTCNISSINVRACLDPRLFQKPPAKFVGFGFGNRIPRVCVKPKPRWRLVALGFDLSPTFCPQDTSLLSLLLQPTTHYIVHWHMTSSLSLSSTIFLAFDFLFLFLSSLSSVLSNSLGTCLDFFFAAFFFLLLS